MSEKLHPTNWTCPDCGHRHSKPHWPDYHQKEPGWKEKLDEHGSYDKPSDPIYQIVCEDCGSKLTTPPDKGLKKECPSKCKPGPQGNYCATCGKALVIPTDYCQTCQSEKLGVPAPLFCPHCGWQSERIILVKAG